MDLVTNAYESQIEAIRNLNKEKAQLSLNENKKGIDKAEKEMTKDDLRDKVKKLGNEHMFDSVLDMSSSSLNQAKEITENYGDIYRQVLTAEMVSDDDKAKTYDGPKELANDLVGLNDIDLQALNENVGKNNSFDKLKEAAEGYDVSVGELIDTLVRLGYVQGGGSQFVSVRWGEIGRAHV